MNRRDFLKAAGAAAGCALVEPVTALTPTAVPMVPFSPGGPMPVTEWASRYRVLMPFQQAFLQNFLDEAGLNVRLVVRFDRRPVRGAFHAIDPRRDA